MKHLILIVSLMIISNCSALAKRDWNCKAEGNKYGCTSIKDIDDDRTPQSLKSNSIKNQLTMGRTEEQIGRI